MPKHSLLSYQVATPGGVRPERNLLSRRRAENDLRFASIVAPCSVAVRKLQATHGAVWTLSMALRWIRAIPPQPPQQLCLNRSRCRTSSVPIATQHCTSCVDLAATTIHRSVIMTRNRWQRYTRSISRTSESERANQFESNGLERASAGASRKERIARGQLQKSRLARIPTA
jgi:hypothetical protein